jgi:hypothetical protein
MTEPATTQPATPSLWARAVGMITAPRATFERIVNDPRPFGILLIVAIMVGIGSAAPQFTDAGKQVILDAQMKAMADRSADGQVSPQQAEQLQRFVGYMPIVSLVGALIFLPIITMFLSALYWALFNVVLGGTASFKQVLSTSSHSQVIAALGVLVGLPFMLMKPTVTMGGPFNLGALAPMLEEGSRLLRFLTNISVFSIWAVFVNAIGLSVIYRRKTLGIFVALLVVYLAFAYLGSMFQG